MSAASLGGYLDRIGCPAGVNADLAGLGTIFRAHVAAVPFENLDVQLARPSTPDIAAAFAKIVDRRRGGWCFESNGVLGWALQQLGFRVTRLAGGVLRERQGDRQLGGHLALMVDLDQPWLVDAGFGGSLAEPIPILEGEYAHAPWQISLRRADGDFWRFSEQLDGQDEPPFSFDFRPAPGDEALIAEKCAFLSRHSASPFVQTLVVQQRQGDAHLALRGRVLVRSEAGAAQRRVLESAEELLDVLARNFRLDTPEAAALWPAICARHEAISAES